VAAMTIAEEPAGAVHLGSVCESVAVHSMIPTGAP
jgi:hypothetical protein